MQLHECMNIQDFSIWFNAKVCGTSCAFCCLCTCMQQYILVNPRPRSGMQGSKNVLTGGDRSGSDWNGEGPFLTYVVYKSYQCPPELQRYDPWWCKQAAVRSFWIHKLTKTCEVSSLMFDIGKLWPSAVYSFCMWRIQWREKTTLSLRGSCLTLQVAYVKVFRFFRFSKRLVRLVNSSSWLSALMVIFSFSFPCSYL